MELKITTLIENNPDDKGALLFEHGFSVLIETDGKKILFDTGKSGAFINNADSLKVSLEDLDYCILSHGHYDHSGGVKRLTEEVVKLPSFIVGEEFFLPKYKKINETDFQYNGNSFEEELFHRKKLTLIKVKEDRMNLTEHCMIFHHFLEQTEFEKTNKRFYVKENADYRQDHFTDEIALGIRTSKGLVVVAGCSHVGIINLLKTISDRIDIPIYAVIGGTHLVEADSLRLQKTVEAFREMKIQIIAVSHCTGEEGIQYIRQEMGQQFSYHNTGQIIEV